MKSEEIKKVIYCLRFLKGLEKYKRKYSIYTKNIKLCFTKKN